MSGPQITAVAMPAQGAIALLESDLPTPRAITIPLARARAIHAALGRALASLETAAASLTAKEPRP